MLAAHPGYFFFQPVKYNNELKKLQEQMLAYYGFGVVPEVPAERVKKNKLFAAKYMNQFYRVVVLDAPVGNRVAVRLCDYGNAIFIPVSNLSELAPEFLNCPFMAVRGKLAGMEANYRDWPMGNFLRFQDLVVNQILAGFIVHTEQKNENPMDMVVTLTLVDIGPDGYRDIAEILISENKAWRAVDSSIRLL